MSLNDEIKAKILPVLRKHGIKKAGLFGSAGRGETCVRDVDLLVEITSRISLFDFIRLQQELEDVLGLPVDLVEYSAIKPSLKEDILREEVPLYL
jgi:predicted nucleotidyltransferase